eukprot:450519_1
MSGAYLKGYESKSKDISIILSLIDYQLYRNKNIKNKFDEYILNTFYAYCKHKKTIKFHMYTVWRDFGELVNVLLWKSFEEIINVSPRDSVSGPKKK